MAANRLRRRTSRQIDGRDSVVDREVEQRGTLRDRRAEARGGLLGARPGKELLDRRATDGLCLGHEAPRHADRVSAHEVDGERHRLGRGLSLAFGLRLAARRRGGRGRRRGLGLTTWRRRRRGRLAAPSSAGGGEQAERDEGRDEQDDATNHSAALDGPSGEKFLLCPSKSEGGSDPAPTRRRSSAVRLHCAEPSYWTS